jgi:hypothetical protein
MFYHTFVPKNQPQAHPASPDDGHNSPPFRATTRTCDQHTRQVDITAKLQCAWHCGDEPTVLSGGQSHHLSEQNLSAQYRTTSPDNIQ